MKILLVEDERILAESIAAHLGSEAFVVETVYSFHDAIEKVNLYSYDCVIVDINLPDGNGFSNDCNYQRIWKYDTTRKSIRSFSYA